MSDTPGIPLRGPWTMEACHPPGRAWILSKPTFVDSDPSLVAEVATGTPDRIATARLIAAAPELMHRLRVVLACFQELDDGWRDMDATLVDQIIATQVAAIKKDIAKAEGRTA